MPLDFSGSDQSECFQRSLDGPDIIGSLRDGLIGVDAETSGPEGPNPLVHADDVTSGRALRQDEHLKTEELFQYFANSHAEASYCGPMMTRLKKKARHIILNRCDGDSWQDVIFTGSGATAGVNRLLSLQGVPAEAHNMSSAVVLIGHYAHQSSILASGGRRAEVIKMLEAVDGGLDAQALDGALEECAGCRANGADERTPVSSRRPQNV